MPKLGDMAETQEHLQLFLLLLLSTIVVRSILTKTRNKLRRPPGPPSLPVIGHLHLISPLIHQSFHVLSTRYGPVVMQLFLGSLPCVVVSCPDMAKQFLQAHEHSFSNRFVSAAVHHLSYGCKGFIFAPYGNMWKFMKKICMSELLGNRTLNQFRHVREQETLRFLQLLKAKGEAREAVNVGGELLTLLNNVMSRMILGRRCCESDGDVEDVRKMVEGTAELVGKFNVADFVWFCKGLDLQKMNKRLREILDRFDRMMERVIREHEDERKSRKERGEGENNMDLLDILLEIHHDQTREMNLTRENVKAFILDIILAGIDTSAITIEWALAELINNPHVMKKARQEINSVTRNKRLIQESDLANLPYLQAIVKETLRIHPTSPFIIRESSESCNVCDYEIPAKCLLFINLWSIGRDPKLWEKPLEFMPERFMSEENKFDVRGQNFQLMPFGTGRRLCPGVSLALQVVPINLAVMIQCFEWKVDGEVSMEEKPAITLPRAHPLICVPIPHLSLSF